MGRNDQSCLREPGRWNCVFMRERMKENEKGKGAPGRKVTRGPLFFMETLN